MYASCKLPLSCDRLQHVPLVFEGVQHVGEQSSLRVIGVTLLSQAVAESHRRMVDWMLPSHLHLELLQIINPTNSYVRMILDLYTAPVSHIESDGGKTLTPRIKNVKKPVFMGKNKKR